MTDVVADQMRLIELMYVGIDGAIERACDEYVRDVMGLDAFEDQLDWLLGIAHA